MEVLKKGSEDVFETGPAACCYPAGTYGTRYF